MFLLAATCIMYFSLSTLCLWRITNALGWTVGTLNRRADISQEHPSKTEIIILLPALEEQRIVESTLSYFSTMADKFNPNVLRVVAITSELEAVRASGKQKREDLVLTRNMIQDWIDINHSSCVSIVHDPDIAGSKATKLQYAINILLKDIPKQDSERVLFGIYDFDSRPSLFTFKEIAILEAKEERRDVIQQVPHCIGHGINSLGSPSISRLFALGHLERTFCNEIDYSRKATASGMFGAFRGCMGAGLFIRANVFDQIVEIPINSDDITLGYRLDILGIDRTIMSAPNFVQPTTDFIQLKNQYMKIFSGVHTSFSEIARPQNLLSISGKMHAIFRAIATHARNASVSFRNFLLIFLVCFSFNYLQFWTALALVVVAVSLHYFVFTRLIHGADTLFAISNVDKRVNLSKFERVIGPFTFGFVYAYFVLFFFGKYIWDPQTASTGIDKSQRH